MTSLHHPLAVAAPGITPDLDLHHQFGLATHRRPRRDATAFGIDSANERFPAAADAATAAVETRRLSSASSSYSSRM